MSDADLIHALKVAFTYLPQAMDVNEYDFPGRVDKTLADIECVREALLARGIDPDEVAGEFDLGAPESSL
jgi:hypothetical protein